MPWVYLSPHFDDAALSCGGLIWEQVQARENVSIWTVCAGEPAPDALSPFASELHSRWKIGQNAPEQRKLEDKVSCQLLGASIRYFSLPDCIYRRSPKTAEFMYASEVALTGPLHTEDAQSIHSVQESLKRSLTSDMILVAPLALGNHVDHQLVRAAVEGLDCPACSACSACYAWYYQDYPYVLLSTEQLEKLCESGWTSQIFPVSQEGLLKWQDSIAAHASQISTFWPGEREMRQAIADYCNQYTGIQLWRKPA